MELRHNREPIHVRHAELIRTGESGYRSNCPVCKKGVLLVRRNPKNPVEIEELDNCVLCGQTFIYDDIEDLRKPKGPVMDPATKAAFIKAVAEYGRTLKDQGYQEAQKIVEKYKDQFPDFEKWCKAAGLVVRWTKIKQQGEYKGDG
jgi:hypothetical protein